MYVQSSLDSMQQVFTQNIWWHCHKTPHLKCVFIRSKKNLVTLTDKRLTRISQLTVDFDSLFNDEDYENFFDLKNIFRVSNDNILNRFYRILVEAAEYEKTKWMLTGEI